MVRQLAITWTTVEKESIILYGVTRSQNLRLIGLTSESVRQESENIYSSLRRQDISSHDIDYVE